METAAFCSDVDGENLVPMQRHAHINTHTLYLKLCKSVS